MKNGSGDEVRRVERIKAYFWTSGVRFILALEIPEGGRRHERLTFFPYAFSLLRGLGVIEILDHAEPRDVTVDQTASDINGNQLLRDKECYLR